MACCCNSQARELRSSDPLLSNFFPRLHRRSKHKSFSQFVRSSFITKSIGAAMQDPWTCKSRATSSPEFGVGTLMQIEPLHVLKNTAQNSPKHLISGEDHFFS